MRFFSSVPRSLPLALFLYVCSFVCVCRVHRFVRVVSLRQCCFCYLERTKIMFAFLHVRIPLFKMQTNGTKRKTRKKRNKITRSNNTRNTYTNTDYHQLMIIIGLKRINAQHEKKLV